MDTIDRAALGPLFNHLDAVFTAERDALIALDGQVGDSDLGLTMNKAFGTARATVDADTTSNLGRLFALAGMAMAKAAPSTMGTLVATGFMRGGKAVRDASALGPTELAVFWEAFRDGIAERGKAKPGDKTIVDVLGPIATALRDAAENGKSVDAALDDAVIAAGAALEATRAMVAQHGKAAVYAERTRGLQDAGATVGVLIITGFRDVVGRSGAPS